MGANAKEGTRIGDRAILGMGASLFNDLEADLIALGNPARSIQRNTQGKVFKR
jgi:acetyltransferase-like isoleucine patch superfamily enzyme